MSETKEPTNGFDATWNRRPLLFAAFGGSLLVAITVFLLQGSEAATQGNRVTGNPKAGENLIVIDDSDSIPASLTNQRGNSASKRLMIAIFSGAVTLFSAVSAVFWCERSIHRLQLHIDEQAREVTRLDQWRREVRDEARRAITALDQMRDGVFVLDEDGRVMFLNPAAKRLLQIEEQSHQDTRPIYERVRFPPLAESVTALIDGSPPRSFELEIVEDKKVRTLEGMAERFALGNRSQILVTLRDQSEIKEMEALRRDLIANLSHELKTPVAAIKGYAETVELAIDDDIDTAERFLRQISTQCDVLEHMVADMLQLARAQSGEQQMRLTEFSLDEVVRNSIASVEMMAAQKLIRIEKNEGQGLSMNTDQEAVITIFNNLLSNAIRYTPAEGRVTVGYETTRNDPEMVTIFVEDTGIGIAEEDQPRVFDRFFRANRSRKKRGGSGDASGRRGTTVRERSGTGIGLSIVQTLTDTLGGSIDLTSEVGRGSRFEINLPIDLHEKFTTKQSTPGL